MHDAADKFVCVKFAKGLGGGIDNPNQAFARRMLLTNLCQFAKGLIGDVDIPNQAVCMMLLTNSCVLSLPRG